MTSVRSSSVTLAVIVVLSCAPMRSGACVYLVWYSVFVPTSAPLQCREAFKNSLSTPY